MRRDVLVIGGRAIGCGAALALARRGASVQLIERTHLGAEASGAAAGILGAYAEAHDTGPLAQLCLQSLALYPAWSAQLVDETGIDVGYRPSGSMRVFLDADDLARQSRAMTAGFGAGAQPLDSAAVLALEPHLAPSFAGALRFPRDGRIDPPALVRALGAAAVGAGVVITLAAGVERLVVAGDRATGVILANGEALHAGAVVLAAGAWSPIEGSGLAPSWVEPIRGQIVELRTDRCPIEHVVFGPSAYLSPRDDGRVIVGSTQERAGFHKAVTVRGVRGLLDGAVELVPGLAEAEIARTWSGFRPRAPDGAPLLGPGHARGLFVATGHFRNGILLAPITGEIIAALVLGGAPPIDLTPFAPQRFSVC
jgi:glycine oxidase